MKKILYHGSNINNIKNFNHKGQIGSFFISDYDIAKSYGKYVYKCIISINNSLNLDDNGIQNLQDDLIKIFYDIEDDGNEEEILDDFRDFLLYNNEMGKDIKNDFNIDVNDYESLLENLKDFLESFLRLNYRQIDYSDINPIGSLIKYYCLKNNYDGIILNYDNQIYRGDKKEYIIWNDYQITILDILTENILSFKNFLKK